LLAANPHCAATFNPIRSIGSFIKSAAQQNKRSVESTGTLCAHLRLASRSISGNKSLLLRSGDLTGIFGAKLIERELTWKGARNAKEGV